MSPIMADTRKEQARRSSMSASTVVGGSSGSDAVTSTTPRVKKWAPKVRTGCLTCRSRRVKCDEGKPECNRCISTGRKCEGYRAYKPKGPKSSSAASRRKLHNNPDAGQARQAIPERPYGISHSLSASSNQHAHLERESSSETAPIDQQLSNLLGELRVDERGAAPYLRHQERWEDQSDTQEETHEDEDALLEFLPPRSQGSRHRFRIPPPLMPPDQQAMRYFELYFAHVHPYVPVLDQNEFYKQWHANRGSISPLLLEVLLAIGSRIAHEPPRISNCWLALASKCADDFMDIPTLSTLQALLILLKAREAAPKRGYFYRSWMLVVQCVRMGKDIGLDEHHETHKAGHSCGFNPSECRLQTRIWQTVFVCETMVGTPQGRHDLSVNTDTVDFDEPTPIHVGATAGAVDEDVDQSEHRVSRRFTYLARIVLNVRRLHGLYQKFKREKDWGMKPEYLAFESTMTEFLSKLPPDMSVSMSSHDTSLPVLDNAFVGNLLSYYHLSIILFHRGALGFIVAPESCGQWKHRMMICYDSARRLCRLQEAILGQFGLSGLQDMQRGFSFTVYAGLSCIVLHLVAIVSPDPDLNTDARDYFERHMRLLETVMQAWSMPDLQKQIDAFREAFSIDLSQPFVLRPSFPYVREPAAKTAAPEMKQEQHHGQQPLPDISDRFGAGTYPLHQRQGQPGYSQGTTSQAALSHNVYSNEPPSTTALETQSMTMPPSASTHPSWNPAPIFETWNSFFAPPPPPPKPFAVPIPQEQRLAGGTITYASPGMLSTTMQGLSSPATQQDDRASSLLPNYEQIPQLQQNQVPQQYPIVSSVPGFITPAMWQDLVATVYADGQTDASMGL